MSIAILWELLQKRYDSFSGFTYTSFFIKDSLPFFMSRWYFCFLILPILGCAIFLPHEYFVRLSSLFISRYASSDVAAVPCDEQQKLTKYFDKEDAEKKACIIEQTQHTEQAESLLGTVVYHPHTSFSHVLWINLGSSSSDIPFPIEKNCPVVCGDTLIGIVEYVGSEVSLVRLLSDPKMRPAVRVVREHTNSALLAQAICTIQQSLEKNPSLYPREEFAATLNKLLTCLYASLPSSVFEPLAKGEIQGVCFGEENVFVGVGFNYESDDEEGKRRDLRTGAKEDGSSKTPLIMPGDLLETSGKDGTFPKGLKVATVIDVDPIEEGAVSYSIKARSTAIRFPDFDYVFVLPKVTSCVPQEPTLADQITFLLSEKNS